MTLNQIEQDVLRRLGFATSSVDSATKTRLDAFINETQQEILSEPGMEVLLNDSVTFASVASTPQYSLPPVVARIRKMTETTNQRELTPQSLGWYRAAYPAPTAVTGTPDHWVDMGYAAMATQPSDASELFVKSTDNVTDTGASKKAYIEGYVTGGYYRSANVALTGTTAVSFGAAITTWIEVTKFYLDFTPVGNITINEDSGAGTELSRIPIGQTQARYRRIALAIAPSAAITYTVDFERDVPDMSVANDEPLLPPRFHRLIAVGARMREYEKQDQPRRYQAAQQEYLVGIRKLRMFLYSQAVGTPNLRNVVSIPRGSRLGAWFASGT